MLAGSFFASYADETLQGAFPVNHTTIIVSRHVGGRRFIDWDEEVALANAHGLLVEGGRKTSSGEDRASDKVDESIDGSKVSVLCYMCLSFSNTRYNRNVLHKRQLLFPALRTLRLRTQSQEPQYLHPPTYNRSLIRRTMHLLSMDIRRHRLFLLRKEALVLSGHRRIHKRPLIPRNEYRLLASSWKHRMCLLRRKLS